MTSITTKTALYPDEKRRVARNDPLEIAASDFAVWDYDLTSGRVRLSDVWSVLLGEPRKPTFATIQDLTELVPVEDRMMVKAATIRAIKDQNNRVYQVIHRIIKPSDGSVIWVRTEGKVVRRDEEGYALRMVGLSRDTTESVTAHMSVQESDERVHMLLDYAPAAVALFDRDMRYMAVSNRWITDYKLGNRDIIGKLHYEVFPNTTEIWKERHRLGLSGETLQAEDEFYTHDDATTLWLKWKIRPWHEANGNIGGIVIFTEDITVRRELALADKEKFNTILRLKNLGELFVNESTLEPVLKEIVDISITITNADFGTIQLLDKKTGNLIIAAHRDLPSQWLEYWATVNKGQATCGAAMERRQRVIDEDIYKSPLFENNEALEMHQRAGIHALQSTPLISRSGDLLGIFSTYYKSSFQADREDLLMLDLLALQAADIIERFELERSVRKNHKRIIELHRKQVALQTVSAIAHEMNQPLISISNYCATAQRLLDGPSPDLSKVRDALRKSEDQTLRAGETIRNLLSLLQKSNIKTEKLNLNGEIRSVMAAVKKEYDLHFSSRLRLDKNLPPVMANRLHLRQVLFNLLNNGIEAMRDYGIPTPEIMVRVKTRKDQSVAMVTIRDNGPGFAKEHINQLFEPFFTTKPNGIGMGLVVSRALIEENGGQLWVDPEEGPGAVFHFTLPLAL